MKGRTIESYIEEVKARWVGPTDDVWVTLAMVGEAGEIANAVKKETRTMGGAATCIWHGHQDLIAEEIVDTLFYLFKLAGQRGIDVGAAWDAKMAELERRGYPPVAAY